MREHRRYLRIRGDAAATAVPWRGDGNNAEPQGVRLLCDPIRTALGSQGGGHAEMLAYLRALASRLIGRGFDPFRPPFADPPVGVREPRRRGPGGRSSAVAVEEPPDSTFVLAQGSVGSGQRPES